ncbi:uncharacterized protein LOC106171543, partial [Lingula anatina]|uniref:Uncharacterized protein LOC106171543 n=1 Tax=Lingula anatina TaxID=7574 RepID=A0A1S3JBY3_LINAN
PAVASRTQDTLTISWQKWSPQAGSGVSSVHSYVIRVWQQDGQPSNVTVPSENNTATIINLSHYTEYNVSVIIWNNAGYYGLPSPTTTARTCGEPVAPPNPNVNSFFDLSQRSTYMEIKTMGMNQEIHRCDWFAKLTVRYEGEFNNGTTDVLRVNESQLITITNLTANSTYTIYLTAVNNLLLVGPPLTVTHTTTEGGNFFN